MGDPSDNMAVFLGGGASSANEQEESMLLRRTKRWSQRFLWDPSRSAAEGSPDKHRPMR
jgi:hypothetical protein